MWCRDKDPLKPGTWLHVLKYGTVWTTVGNSSACNGVPMSLSTVTDRLTQLQQRRHRSLWCFAIETDTCSLGRRPLTSAWSSLLFHQFLITFEPVILNCPHPPHWCKQGEMVKNKSSQSQTVEKCYEQPVSVEFGNKKIGQTLVENTDIQSSYPFVTTINSPTLIQPSNLWWKRFTHSHSAHTDHEVALTWCSRALCSGRWHAPTVSALNLCKHTEINFKNRHGMKKPIVYNVRDSASIQSALTELLCCTTGALKPRRQVYCVGFPQSVGLFGTA